MERKHVVAMVIAAALAGLVLFLNGNAGPRPLARGEQAKPGNKPPAKSAHNSSHKNVEPINPPFDQF
ncbi:unnamed protein product [marine sediment metagenome]|uniref:Uncharacterized protein n=1 Tax=marine sediment metagenome TaxID=412755 RepID=X0TPM9_9ZZZZ